MIIARNAHQALPEIILKKGQSEDPPLICYLAPAEMVLFWEELDDDPFERLFSSLKMVSRIEIEGSQDVGDDRIDILTSGWGVGIFVDTPEYDILKGRSYAMLLLYAAAKLGLNVGNYVQTAAQWTCDKDRWEKVESLMWETDAPCLYEAGYTESFPLISSEISTWEDDLKMFLEEGEAAIGYRDPFFRRVAVPVLRAREAYEHLEPPAKFDQGIKILSKYEHDWAIAGEQWLNRRAAEWKK